VTRIGAVHLIPEAQQGLARGHGEGLADRAVAIRRLVPPTRAEYVPECAPPADPLRWYPRVVQPVKLPVSNPPLVMPPLESAVTPRVTVVVCVAEVPAPVTVIVYVPAGVVADVANVSREDRPS